MKGSDPSIAIDSVADAAYISFSGAEVARTEEVGDGLILDCDAQDRPVGLEISSVKARVGTNDPASYLRGLAEGVLDLRRAAAE
jgi:uncharacterized protein YuzE